MTERPGPQVFIQEDAGLLVPQRLERFPITGCTTTDLRGGGCFLEYVSDVRERIAIGNIKAHQPDIGERHLVSRGIISSVVIHGAVIKTRFVFRCLERADRMVVRIHRAVLGVAAPHE